jgi:hypothetical protein
MASAAHPTRSSTQIRSHSPAIGRRLVHRPRRQHAHQEVGLGSNPNPGDASGKAFLGVAPATSVVEQRVRRSMRARDSVFDLGPTLWQSVRGVVKVLNPVNIVGHLTGANKDVNTRRPPLSASAS